MENNKRKNILLQKINRINLVTIDEEDLNDKEEVNPRELSINVGKNAERLLNFEKIIEESSSVLSKIGEGDAASRGTQKTKKHKFSNIKEFKKEILKEDDSRRDNIKIIKLNQTKNANINDSMNGKSRFPER